MSDQKPDLSKIPFADLKAMRDEADEYYEFLRACDDKVKAKKYASICKQLECEIETRLTDLFPELKK